MIHLVFPRAGRQADPAQDQAGQAEKASFCLPRMTLNFLFIRYLRKASLSPPSTGIICPVVFSYLELISE